MQRKPPHILYWKWDEGILIDGRMEKGAADILKRSSRFDLIYVSFHHLGVPFEDPRLQSLIRRLAALLRQAGRGLMLDIDVRCELDGFLRRFPGRESRSLRPFKGILDSQGRLSVRLPNPVSGRTGRNKAQRGPLSIVGAWAFEEAGAGLIREGTLHDIEVCARDFGRETEYSIDCGAEMRGLSVFVVPSFFAGIPDLFSPDLYTYYEEMFRQVSDVPLHGVATDEWGLDLAIENDDGLFSVRAFPYSDNLAAAYARAGEGADLARDVLHFAYAVEGETHRPVEVITRYLAVLRRRMTENNDWFYAAGKRYFGADAFIGVHPTLWGDASDCAFDFLHNGLSWWETRRDYAQTDEFVIMPIRLAMAHKWGGPVWYNMWYSGNTQQLDTYWPESWRNARYGGRTHYLGYECPNEPGVFRLKHPGALEKADALENRLAPLNACQLSQPDSRVLVVFGAENYGNWYLDQRDAEIVRGTARLCGALAFAEALFQTYLCDLVPTTEISNGSVHLSGGKPRLGSQIYDAVIFLEPQYAAAAVRDFAAQYARAEGQIIVCGAWDCDERGLPLPMDDFEVCTFPMPTSVLSVIKQLRAWGIFENHDGASCVYQDGSVLFTTPGTLPTGNYLSVNANIHGHSVAFEGEDFLYLHKQPNGDMRAAYGDCTTLTIDGETGEKNEL